jgi:hypothetical protein
VQNTGTRKGQLPTILAANRVLKDPLWAAKKYEPIVQSFQRDGSKPFGFTLFVSEKPDIRAENKNLHNFPGVWQRRIWSGRNAAAPLWTFVWNATRVGACEHCQKAGLATRDTYHLSDWRYSGV